jgi:stage V sporulation protein AB
MILSYGLAIFAGLASGAVIAGAVFAFITVIGVVPRLAQKTGTGGRVRIYETAIAAGGIFGSVAGAFHLRVPLPAFLVAAMALAGGIFFGCLAMALAETLDVLPIMSRRGGTGRGMGIFVTAIAIGKTVGSLMYFFIQGFYDMGAA